MPTIKLAFGSCLNAADSAAFDRIRLLTPDYFYGAGDLWYDDGSTDHVAHWTAFFAKTKVAAMVALLPNPPVIGWSDHDFGFGANATAGAITTTANAAYRTKFGSTDLPAVGIYRTWVSGRVRFVLCDERSFKSANAATDDATKTILGPAQKTWLKALLASNTYPLIVVLGDVPWVGSAVAGDDGWKGYTTEREELRQSYAASPAQVIRLSGDMHCLGVGRDQFGIDRVWQAAPFSNITKVKAAGEGYTATYPTNLNEGSTEELLGLVTLNDSGSQIACSYAGYSSDGTVRVTDSLTVSAPAGSPVLPATFLDAVPYPTIPVGTSVVNVTSSAALTTALANATAGQRIMLAGGTYSGAFSLSGKVGTSAAGISVEAVTTGGAVFGAGSTLLVTNCAYVTLKGLSLPYELGAGNILGFRGSSHHCRVTRCLFGPPSLGTAGTTKATFIYGGDDVNQIRVDHNELRFKTNPGNAILFDGNFTTNQTCQHIRIDHNWVHGIAPEVSNEKEPIRLGVSTMSKSFGYSVVERNRFDACIAEPEIVSIKSCGNRMSGNTVSGCIGGLVYRHGTGGQITDNYIVDTGASPPPPPPPSGTYRYFRFAATAVRDPTIANSLQLSEFAILNGTTRQTGMTVTATNNNSPVGEEPDKAGDNTTATKWLTLNSTASALVYTFPTTVAADGYRWATGNDSPERDPVSWTVQGSTDGATWTVLDTRTNYTGTTARSTFNPDLQFGGGGSTGGVQTLGVGGIARPAPASNVELNSANRGDMNITVSGTASVPRIYDGGGFTCGRVTISADYIIVQNYNIRPRSQYGVYITGSHCTVQNNDIKDIMLSGDGDLNAITLLEGSFNKFLYNTAINYVTGSPGSSHTDCLQTWVSSSHPTACSNIQIVGNKFVGPSNPSRDNSIPSIHQCIMVESAGHGGNSGGSGTPSNWFISDNEFGDSWGQSIKTDCGNNFIFTRNRWTGSSDHVFSLDCGTGTIVYSDNVFGSGYGNVNATITSGSGPATSPY